MITPKAYFMERDVAFPDELTPELREHAGETIARANVSLELAAADGVAAARAPRVASGWRPRAVNDATAHAAAASRHLTCQAVDTVDDGDRGLARWCLRNLAKLEAIGLWMEDPRWTPTWVHWQTVPPASGHRVYVPSTAPALAAALPEQVAA